VSHLVNYNRTHNNYELAYSSQQLIKRSKEVYHALPSGLYFNKGLSFVNSEMQKRGHRIGLPHCWYRWGDEVVRYQMPKELIWTHEEASYTKVDWKGGSITLKDESRKRDVNELIEEFIDNYPLKDDNTIELLLADHYEKAPFEFQRRYKTVRDILFDITISGGKSYQLGNDSVLTFLERAFESFPEDKLFKRVSYFIPAFMEVIKYLSSGYLEEMKMMNEISEEFWYLFCYFLRTHPSAHENVSEATLAFWRSEIDNETDRFLRNFEDHVLSLSHKYNDISQNSVLLHFLEEGKRVALDFAKTFEGYDETMSDLDEFLSERINLE